MTLMAFQNALADLIAAPEETKRLRAGDTALVDRYDLTDVECRRLVAIATAPGMATNCLLYRAHRMTPLATLLPKTVAALGDGLRAAVDAFWESSRGSMMQFQVEAVAFADFVSARSDDPAFVALVTRELADAQKTFAVAEA